MSPLDELLGRIAGGSEEAMRELCLDWRHILEDLASKLLSGRAEIDDVVQETLVAIWVARAGYDRSRPAWPWVTRILRNRCHDVWRKQGGRRREGISAALPLEYAEYVPSSLAGPEEQAERKDLLSQARACVGRLPPTLREVVWLSVVKGMGEEEISGLLCIARGTVKSRKHRGVRMLKAELERSREDGTP